MKSVKVILIAMEVAMLAGVIMISFCNWGKEAQYEEVWMLKALLVLFAIAAVVFQSEQQKIDWDEKLEEED